MSIRVTSAVVLCIAFGLTGCTPSDRAKGIIDPLDISEERSAAQQILRDLQAPSFANNIEYCGALLRTADGSLIRSEIFEGKTDSCRIDPYVAAAEVVASFHTHGAHLPQYDNEVPSVKDLEEEMRNKSDGYVSTPGGRFWHVDGRAARVTMICGVGCLPVDPNYESDTFLNRDIESSYDFAALKSRTETKIALSQQKNPVAQ